MKIGITGYNGNIGKELVRLGGIPLECSINYTDPLRETILKVDPDVIIHCAAKTNVDECEQDFHLAYHVNTQGTLNVLQCSGGRPVILLSTDHIFDGKKGKYSEKDHPSNLGVQSVYGLSKYGAEAVMESFGGKIIRLSKVFNDNFRVEIQDLSTGKYPTFIYRSYVYVKHAALGIWYFANHHDTMPNVLNIAGTEILSAYEFALMAASVFNVNKNTIKPRTKPDNSFAFRPFKGGLNVTKARKLGVPLFSAYEGLVQLKQEKEGTN